MNENEWVDWPGQEMDEETRNLLELLDQENYVEASRPHKVWFGYRAPQREVA